MLLLLSVASCSLNSPPPTASFSSTAPPLSFPTPTVEHYRPFWEPLIYPSSTSNSNTYKLLYAFFFGSLIRKWVGECVCMCVCGRGEGQSHRTSLIVCTSLPSSLLCLSLIKTDLSFEPLCEILRVPALEFR